MDSEYIAELAKWLKRQPFEPFSESSISARQMMPEMLMLMAKFSFGGETTEADRTAALEQLHIRLQYMAHLAENGMAVADHGYAFEPYGTTARCLLTSMQRAFGRGGSQEDQDDIRYSLNCLLPWIELGLAIPTSDVAQ